MGNSHNNGAFLCHPAWVAADIHTGNGQYEEGAVRRVGDPRTVSGFKEPGVEPDLEVS